MATYEHTTLMQYKDQNGDMHITYPITKAENVDGLYGDAVLTGVPTAPTAATGTNTTQIATTAFVQQELDDVKATIPEEADLSGYVKTSDLASVATSGSYNDLTDKPTIPEGADLSGYASLDSPALTGVPTAPTAAAGTNTTQIATTAFVQTELTEVKKSVSDGKTSVANAITAKGITTATDATFDTMAANIAAIESGGGSSALLLNVFTQETEPKTKEGIWIQTANPHQSVVVGSEAYDSSGTMTPGEWVYVGKPPYASAKRGCVVFNNKIHLLGGGNSLSYTKHYVFDGGAWTEDVAIPVSFSGKKAVVFNNEIHILGGTGTGSTNHYKFDGTQWTSVSTLPGTMTHDDWAIVYDNKIHIQCKVGRNYYYHYIFDGSSWTDNGRMDSLVGYFPTGSSVVVWNDAIHLMGGMNNERKHYKFDGNSWTSVDTLPMALQRGTAVVYNNEIHIMSGEDAPTAHYKFDGNEWSRVTTIPFGNSDYYTDVAVVYGDKIHIIGNSSSAYMHYSLSFIKQEYDGSKIAIYQNPSNDTGAYATNFISGVSIAGENNKFPSGFDDVFYIDNSGNVEESPTYYGDGTQWIKFKN